MSRNRFTRVVRESERQQFARQEKGLVKIALRLKCKPAEEDTETLTESGKDARRIRRERNRRHKPVRFRLRADQQ